MESYQILKDLFERNKVEIINLEEKWVYKNQEQLNLLLEVIMMTIFGTASFFLFAYLFRFLKMVISIRNIKRNKKK